MKDFEQYVTVKNSNQKKPSHKQSLPVLNVVQKLPSLTNDLKNELFSRDMNEAEAVPVHQKKRDRKKLSKQGQLKVPFEDSRDASEFNDILGEKGMMKKPSTSFRQNEDPIESISATDLSPYTNLTEPKRILSIMKPSDSDHGLISEEKPIKLNSYKWGS